MASIDLTQFALQESQRNVGKGIDIFKDPTPDTICYAQQNWVMSVKFTENTDAVEEFYWAEESEHSLGKLIYKTVYTDGPEGVKVVGLPADYDFPPAGFPEVMQEILKDYSEKRAVMGLPTVYSFAPQKAAADEPAPAASVPNAGEVVCPTCGVSRPATGFCPNCGAAAPVAVDLTKNAAPGAETVPPTNGAPNGGFAGPTNTPPANYVPPVNNGFAASAPAVFGIQPKNIALCIILSLVTCGIYGIYWIYSMAEDLNKISGDPNPTSGGVVVLLSIVTCGIYLYYWTYKAGTTIDQYNSSRGVPSSNSGILYLILTLCGLSIVTYALIQNNLNQLA